MKRTTMFVLRAACGLGLLCGSGLAMGQTASSDTPSSVSPKDAKLEKRIDYRLQHDAKLKGRVLDSSVSGGVVTLTGTVLTSAEKARAERLARSKGVTVDNQIQVEGETPAPSTSSSGESGTVTTPSDQQAQPEPGSQVRERTTRVEERTETRTERMPQPPQQEPSPPPSDEVVPAPSSPSRPRAPQPLEPPR